MPPDLSIRRYEPADADAVWAVHEAALRASPLAFVEDAPADADLRSIEASYLDARGEFLVGEGTAGCDDAARSTDGRDGVATADGRDNGAVDGGDDAAADGSDDVSVDGSNGTAGDGADVADDGPDTAIVAVGGYVPVDERTVGLRHLRVHPDHQRRGHGRRLLGALERRARVDGYEVARLETVEPLQAAIALYRDAGYEVVEREAHPGTGDEVLTLRREL